MVAIENGGFAASGSLSSYKVCMEPIDPDKGEARISFWRYFFDHEKHGKSSANNLTTWRS